MIIGGIVLVAIISCAPFFIKIPLCPPFYKGGWGIKKGAGFMTILGIPILSLLIFFPILGAIILCFINKRMEELSDG